MSILDRLGLNGHLNEARLAAIWTDASLTGQEPADAHLQECAVCRSHYAEFSDWLEQIRLDADAEADAAFPAEQLAAQRAHILRRIEAAERPARVIAFPKFARPISAGGSHARRWVTAAAAAGLIVGVAVGQLMDLHSLGVNRARRVQAGTMQPQPKAAQPAIQPASTIALSDDVLMTRLEELSNDRTIPDSLVALDSLTPRARDYVNRPR